MLIDYIHQWQNLNYWIGLNKQRRNEQKKKYNKVVEEHSQAIHKQVRKLIKNKYEYFIK